MDEAQVRHPLCCAYIVSPVPRSPVGMAETISGPLQISIWFFDHLRLLGLCGQKVTFLCLSSCGGTMFRTSIPIWTMLLGRVMHLFGSCTVKHRENIFTAGSAILAPVALGILLG
jgi:hypothetical protein